VISNWPQNLLENLVSESPAMVRRIFEEARGNIESRLAANDEPTFQDLEVHSVDFALSGTLGKCCIRIPFLAIMSKRWMF